MEKKSKILIFAGTTEGRELAEFLSGREFPVEVSVATEYGETLLSPGPFLKIHQGRMEEAEMEAFFPGRRDQNRGGCHASVCSGGLRKYPSGL